MAGRPRSGALDIAAALTTSRVHFAGAVADGLLAVNPVEGAKRPRVTARPVVPLTAREVEALRAAAPGWFRVALTLGAGCGLRQGEATGLTLDRIDFLRREMTVDRQLLPIVAKGEPAELGAPQTDRSYRKVPLADVVVAALARPHQGVRHWAGWSGATP